MGSLISSEKLLYLAYDHKKKEDGNAVVVSDSRNKTPITNLSESGQTNAKSSHHDFE